jgi:hypothetical protein
MPAQKRSKARSRSGAPQFSRAALVKIQPSSESVIKGFCACEKSRFLFGLEIGPQAAFCRVWILFSSRALRGTILSHVGLWEEFLQAIQPKLRKFVLKVDWEYLVFKAMVAVSVLGLILRYAHR